MQCQTNDGIEDTEYLGVLLCPSFDIHRQDLLAGVSELLRPFVTIETLPNNVLVIKNFLKYDKNYVDFRHFSMPFRLYLLIVKIKVSFERGREASYP